MAHAWQLRLFLRPFASRHDKFVRSAGDYLRALDTLAAPGAAPRLRGHARRPLGRGLDLDIPALLPLLAAPLATLVRELLVAPGDFAKEMAAWHLSGAAAHDELDAANEVGPPSLHSGHPVPLGLRTDAAGAARL